MITAGRIESKYLSSTAVIYFPIKKGMVSELKKKHLLLTVALCLSAAAFTGCGNKDTDTNMGGQVTDNPDATDNSLMDDMENGVDDVIDGTEDAVDDAVNGTEDAIDDATGNNTQDKKDNNNSVTSGKDKGSNTNR